MPQRYQLLPWALRITAAVILLQTLYFKFSAHPEAVYIFTTIGMEPWGRIGIGVMELITSLLLLIPRTTWLGAAMALGLMTGAIFFHLTKLGIDVYNDGGRLFVMAIAVFVISLVLLWMNRGDIPLFGKKI
ncbi:MAG: DoxX family protein [Chitinophagales bacterium]|nr:DoxX family protein [Chitinophagales bacterium]